ncbi:MAG: hypothetical protein QW680_01350 [Pyrobaculum sp.]
MGSLERLLKILLQHTSYLDSLNADDVSDVYKYLFPSTYCKFKL